MLYVTKGISPVVKNMLCLFVRSFNTGFCRVNALRPGFVFAHSEADLKVLVSTNACASLHFLFQSHSSYIHFLGVML